MTQELLLVEHRDAEFLRLLLGVTWTSRDCPDHGLGGTWVEARKLLRYNRALRALPRVGFVPSVPSAYRIRRAPAPHCWSTIEAVASVLGVLEGDPDRFAPPLVPFQRPVAQQLAYGNLATARRTGVIHARPRSGSVR